MKKITLIFAVIFSLFSTTSLVAQDKTTETKQVSCCSSKKAKKEKQTCSSAKKGKKACCKGKTEVEK